MPKKTKSTKDIKKLTQIDGKLEKPETNKPAPRTIAEVLGIRDGKYNTSNVETYEKELTESNLSDLQSHAADLGLRFTDDRKTMITRLLREFKSHIAQFKTVNTTADTSVIEMTPELKKILSAGR